MTPRIEAIVDTLFSEASEDHLEICRLEIAPAVSRLVHQGIPPNAIIRALAEATDATIDHGIH
jgi:hypothetical protein